MSIPDFDAQKFSSALVLDEVRECFEAMTKEQQKVVRLAFKYGYHTCKADFTDQMLEDLK
jgi:hypothetical protein